MTAFEQADTNDPCLQIQADLSAMLDGELDAASVRRVMVHSDACPSCRAFLDGIRVQARAHTDLHACLTTTDADAEIEIGGYAGRPVMRVRAAELRKQLTENRLQLARILYELGRGFVLMGVSPSFSRIVCREPVPLPDMFMRGRSLLDEVERMTTGASQPEASADPESRSEWVRAKALFQNDGLRSPSENLDKGRTLLGEALTLCPDFHEARIYVGHAHHVAGQNAAALIEFERVLESAEDVNLQAFARLNIGNVHLIEGRLEDATRAFLALVESGAVKKSPQFGIIYFNLALAYGLQERLDDCRDWLQRLYSELPHKRRMMAEEFRSRHQFAGVLARNPEFQRDLAERFPCWFPLSEAC